MTTPFVIDFVSDIVCPWCVVGLYSLEKALQDYPGIAVDFRLHPYELDQSSRREGENMLAHIERKYGIPPEEVRQGLEEITRRGAEVGFTFNFTDESMTWNTFDAHRIIHWAKAWGKDLAVKKALFTAYFTENKNPGDHQLLAGICEKLGLDHEEALRVLESGKFTDEVRQEITLWKSRGVSAVPTIRLQEKQTFTGAQTVSAFKQAIQSSLEGGYRPGAPLM